MSFQLSRWVFLRLLGFTYLLAFASLAPQIIGLIGSDGLLPAAQYFERARDFYGTRAYYLLPGFGWLSASDGALHVLCWGGIVLSVLGIAGIAPVATFWLLWASYLSLTVAGQTFLSFQWDVLLLETGLLASLYAPRGWCPALGNENRTTHIDSPVAVGAGVQADVPIGHHEAGQRRRDMVGTHGADTLLPDAADPDVDQLVRAQPARLVPNGLGRHHVLHRADRAVPRVCASSVSPNPRCHLWPLCLFQVTIAATGNYGFFNLLTIVLCLTLLDDEHISRLVPRAVATHGHVRQSRR